MRAARGRSSRNWDVGCGTQPSIVTCPPLLHADARAAPALPRSRRAHHPNMTLDQPIRGKESSLPRLAEWRARRGSSRRVGRETARLSRVVEEGAPSPLSESPGHAQLGWPGERRFDPSVAHPRPPRRRDQKLSPSYTPSVRDLGHSSTVSHEGNYRRRPPIIPSAPTRMHPPTSTGVRFGLREVNNSSANG